MAGSIRVRLAGALFLALLPVLILGVLQSVFAFKAEADSRRQSLELAAGRSAAIAHARSSAQEAAAAVVDPEDGRSAREHVESIEGALYSLAETGKTATGFVDFATALAGAMAQAAEAFQRDGGLSGISTGLIDLDDKIGGLHGSDLVILAARPSMGDRKSTRLNSSHQI